MKDQCRLLSVIYNKIVAESSIERADHSAKVEPAAVSAVISLQITTGQLLRMRDMRMPTHPADDRYLCSHTETYHGEATRRCGE